MFLYLAWAFAAFVSFRYWGERRLKIVTVLDGDTYLGIGRNGKQYRLRLSGCDCPEWGQPLAEEASGTVRDWLQGNWVRVRLRGRDKYERHIAQIRLPDGRDLAGALLLAGLAFPMPGRFSFRALRARAARRGVWGQWRRRMPWESASRSGGWLAKLWHRRKLSRDRRRR